MPLPHWLTRVNLAFGNRLLAPFTTYLPGFGVLEHVGRRSGTVRRTPLTIFKRGPDWFVIAHTYGAEVEWLKNVIAAGECRVKTRGRWVRLAAPRRFTDPSRREMPWLVRPILRVLGVTEFVELRRVA